MDTDASRVTFRRETGVEALDRDGELAGESPPPHLKREALLTGRLQQADAMAGYDLVILQWGRISDRSSGFNAGNWILDPTPECGYADNRDTPEKALERPFKRSVAEYAEAAKHWAHYGHLAAVIAPDLPWLSKVRKHTCMGLEDHQQATLDAYLELAALMEDSSFGDPLPSWRSMPPYVMPVLQGSTGEDYLRHLFCYEEAIPGGLPTGAWIAVGKSALRDRYETSAANIMRDILKYRSDLRLHLPVVVDRSLRVNATFMRAYTIDIGYSWSHDARKHLRDQNDQSELGEAIKRKSTRSRKMELDFGDEGIA